MTTEDVQMDDHDWVSVPLKNVWLGTSCENQETADERIPHLLKCPAAVRFLSCEPLIGGIDLNSDKRYPGGMWLRFGEHSPYGRRSIHWVIVGGESGKNARPMEMSWLTGIADQCKSAGVPVFVKQDSHRIPGQQGRITAEYWGLKQFPEQAVGRLSK